MEILEKFETIKIESPVDKIIGQIRNSIVTGQLQPGQKLPSERQLSERFGVGRTYVREAIKKLEVFGILKTSPQSGTIVSGIDISAMEGLFTNIIKMSRFDFFHLVETRVLIEKFACRQAAERRTNKDIQALEEALVNYENKIKTGTSAENEDFLFHLKIAEASQNPVIKSMMLIIIPDIISIYRKLKVCSGARLNKSKDEHRLIFDCIVNKKPQIAEDTMGLHLKDVELFSHTYKG